MPIGGGSGGGGAGGLVKLLTVTRGSTGALDTGASAIPTGHGWLRVVVIARSAAAAATEAFTLTFNGDGGSHYITAFQQGSAGGSSGTVALGTSIGAAGLWTGNTATATYATTAILDIPFYDNTSWFKSGTLQMNTTDSSVSNMRTANVAWAWNQTTAINQVTFDSTAHLLANSVMTVYSVG